MPNAHADLKIIFISPNGQGLPAKTPLVHQVAAKNRTLHRI
jgi:hypothetical protein